MDYGPSFNVLQFLSNLISSSGTVREIILGTVDVPSGVQRDKDVGV